MRKEGNLLIYLLLFIGFFYMVNSAADSLQKTVLLDTDFEKDTVGTNPKQFTTAKDFEKEVMITFDPTGKENKCVKFVDMMPGGWKPAIWANCGGELDGKLCLDFDWYLTGINKKRGLQVLVRGERNIPTIKVSIGGEGGVKASDILLNVPIKINQWNHLTIISDPISYRDKGRFTIVVTQGKEKIKFKNIPFSKSWDGKKYASTLWNSPYFSGANHSGFEVYIDNVQLKIIEK